MAFFYRFTRAKIVDHFLLLVELVIRRRQITQRTEEGHKGASLASLFQRAYHRVDDDDHDD